LRMKSAKLPTILHVNTEKGLRGGEIQTLEIARRLQARGYPTILLANKRGLLLPMARAAGIETIEFSPRGELDVFSALKIKKVVSQSGAGIVHAHTAQALGLVYLSRVYKDKIGIVATRRVSFPFKSKYSIRKYLIASKIIAVAEDVAAGLVKEGISSEKIAVVHSGINLDPYRKLTDPADIKTRLGVKKHYPVIGVVGALAHHKGHHTFFKAFNRVWTKFPGAIAVYVGDGPAAEDIRRSVESRALPSLFLGHIENVAPIYRAFDIFVLPSSSGEGSPGVIKEAAASMVPVVATNVGGTREILRSNSEALLIPPSDPIKMAEAILALLADEGLRTKLVKAARERVEDFSFENVVDAHEKIYAGLLKERG
jgi:L-malate glycosyltransferase